MRVRVDPLASTREARDRELALESEGRDRYSGLPDPGRTERGGLEAEESLQWDSGMVELGRNVGVEYGGEALYWLALCVEGLRLDGAGNPCQRGPAVFEIGCKRSDWKGT